MKKIPLFGIYSCMSNVPLEYVHLTRKKLWFVLEKSNNLEIILFPCVWGGGIKIRKY